jgi:hypothetical protein
MRLKTQLAATPLTRTRNHPIMQAIRFCFIIAAAILLTDATCTAVAPGQATGYVRVAKIDGVWWFIGPDGAKFVSIGVNHIEPHLWLAPYNKAATLAKYGDDMVSLDGHFNTKGSAAKKWIDQQVKVSRDLGFNTFGKHTHPSIDPKLYQDQVYYVASLETAPLAGWQERHGRGPRPDPFSLDFEQFVEKRVQEVCDQHKGQRNLIGYLYTDVPSWVIGRSEQMKYYDWLLPSVKEHVDVIVVQAYGPWEKDKKLTDMIHEATGKPIFNGDGCFGLAGPNQQEWGVKGYRTGAKTIDEVTSMYEEMLRGMMSTPYYIGWHHCGYLEQWDAAERGDSPMNENGFLDPFEEVRTQWADVLKNINPQAASLHEKN